jgi:hypothetical protein
MSLTNSYTFEFAKWWLGWRELQTSDTPGELQHLAKLARSAQSMIEVGVFEGAASRVLCQNMPPSARLYLVDPYQYGNVLERLFRFSMTQKIARQAVAPWKERVQFLRSASLDAARQLAGRVRADLIFIDAAHDYASVRADFLTWRELLQPGGRIAFHDSHPCSLRPELGPESGPVRLCQEIADGTHGAWAIAETADSITTVRRNAAAAEAAGGNAAP